MSVTQSAGTSRGGSRAPSYGPLGRLGRWTARRFGVVVTVWVLIAVGFGFFAPKAQSALAGAGWEASGSQSVQARHIVDEQFAGLSSSALQVVVHAPGAEVTDQGPAAVLAAAQRVLAADPRITTVVAPTAGVSISADGHTAVGAPGGTGRL